jgi:hypothetical protein
VVGDIRASGRVSESDTGGFDTDESDADETDTGETDTDESDAGGFACASDLLGMSEDAVEKEAGCEVGLDMDGMFSGVGVTRTCNPDVFYSCVLWRCSCGLVP